jgi:tellurite resistance protein
MKHAETGGAISESLAFVAPGRPKLDYLPVGLTGLSVAWRLAHVRYGAPEGIASRSPRWPWSPSF